MSDIPHSDLQRQNLLTDIKESVNNFKQILNSPLNEDAQFRSYHVRDKEICVIYMEGMADEAKISEFVLHAVKQTADDKEAVIDAAYINETLIEIAQTNLVSVYGEAIKMILSGMACLLTDGSSEAVMLETRGFPHRSVEQSTSEPVINGSHEAFNEHFRTNITLVRRYVQSTELITQKMTVGTKIPTQIALMYIQGIAAEASIREVKKRLMCVQSPAVHSSGELQQLIEDHPFAMLPQMLQTERPDRTAACLEEGQIAIIVDNSPYVLIAPVTIFHLFHASDDSFIRWQYGTLLRIVRVLGILISLLLPAFYIALTVHHAHLLPMLLLTSIAESRVNVPFPIVAEVLFMEFAFYLLNEADTRIPSQIGSALGIVGALILGQAAVSAAIISPILIIIIALTGLGNYVIPDYEFGIGIVIYRMILVLLSALLGLYGIVIGMFLFLTQLCSLRAFGIDYMSPVAPKRRHNPDIIVRLPVWMHKKLMFFASGRSWMHSTEKENQK